MSEAGEAQKTPEWPCCAGSKCRRRADPAGVRAFRCYYCRKVYCARCAEKHFDRRGFHVVMRGKKMYRITFEKHEAPIRRVRPLP